VAKYRPFTYGRLPDFIYFDTSFLMLAANGTQEERIEAARFMKRLESRNVFVFVSTLVIFEVWHVALVEAARDYAGEGWERDFERPDFRRSIFPRAQPLIHRVRQDFLDRFIEQGRGQIVAVTPEDMDNAAGFVHDFGLDSYDAAHAGVMRSYDVVDIATNDRDFEQVDSFNLWLAEPLYQRLQDNY
jgi:predicted nucleic acid-binding protein